MKKKIIITAIIAALIILVPIIGYTTNNSIKPENTVELRGTVVKTETVGSGDYERAVIYTEEYDDRLTTFSVKSLVRANEFSHLMKGDTIYFTVEKTEAEKISKGSKDLIKVIALRDDDRTYVSLDEYKLEASGGLPIWVRIIIYAFIVIIVISLTIAYKKRRARTL